jgi:hypothetical protein
MCVLEIPIVVARATTREKEERIDDVVNTQVVESLVERKNDRTVSSQLSLGLEWTGLVEHAWFCGIRSALRFSLCAKQVP